MTVRTNIHLSARVYSPGSLGTAEPTSEGDTFAARRSAGLVFFHGHGGVDVASATCIRLAGRCFLATAGHNLDGVRRDRDIRIVPLSSSRDRWLPFLRRNATRDRRPESYDIGWIEIASELATAAGLRFLGEEHLGISTLSSRPAPGRQGAAYLIHGLPAGLATHGLHARGRVIHLQLLAYRTLASDRDEQRRHRLSLRYDRRARSESRAASTNRDRLPPAHGLSGGGVWRVGDSGEAPRLVAIVRSWHRREQRLSSVPIGRWLDLVARDLPELRPAIDRLRRNRKSH